MKHFFDQWRLELVDTSTTNNDNSPTKCKHAIDAIQYWKSNHSKPSNTSNVSLNNRIHKFDRGLTTADDEDVLYLTIEHRHNLNARGQNVVDILQDLGVHTNS
jgi:uncharacterized protein YcgI (DUF1989 family)